MTETPKSLLDLDLNSVDTSFPIIKAGIYDMVIKESSVADNKASDGKNWVFKLATTIPTDGVKGEKFDIGHIVTSQLSLKTKSEKKTEDQMKEIIVKNAARILQAIRPPVTGITGKDLFDGSFEVKCKALQGRMIRVKLDALPERKDKESGKTLSPTNDIAQFIKA